jgi:hypothetical protein
MSCIACILLRIKTNRGLRAMTQPGTPIYVELTRMIEEDEVKLKEKENG